MEFLHESGIQIAKVGDAEPTTLLLHPLGHTPKSMNEHIVEIAKRGRTVVAPNLFDIAEKIQATGENVSFKTISEKIKELSIFDSSSVRSIVAFFPRRRSGLESGCR